MFVQE